MSGGKQMMGIYLTRDGGESWTAVKIGEGDGGSISTVVLDPKNGNIIYAAGLVSDSTSVLYKSSNGGASWTPLNSPSVESSYKPEIAALAVDPSAPNTLYALCRWGSEVFRSTDGGATWTRLPLPQESGFGYQGYLAVNPSKTSEIFVGGEKGVFYSGDGGATWTDLSADLPVKKIRGVFIDGPKRQLYVGTYGAGVCQRSF